MSPESPQFDDFYREAGGQIDRCEDPADDEGGPRRRGNRAMITTNTSDWPMEFYT
jgi:hypothetical protein